MDYKLIAPRDNSIGLLEQILLNRGIAQEDIWHFLNVNENDVLDPLLLTNMREGVGMLIKHIAGNEKTLVVVDSDCDGYCSAALLLNYLNRHFPAWVQNQVQYFMHNSKQHGLSDVAVADLIQRDIKFVICPDSASNDYTQHETLHRYGIDVLVIDHHEAEYVSDFACVINNQLCDYPTKSLCGGAMVYKFCCYIDSLMKTEFAIEYEDLAALSLIGDMMDQRDFETHYFINDGLKRIRNPFFVEMMNRQQRQFEGGITPIGIAFYIVPYINAMTRSGTQDEKYLMFEAMLEWRADEYIPSTKRGCKGQVEKRTEQAGRTAINVKNRQKRAQDASLENIENIVAEYELLDSKMLIVTVSENEVDKNLAGLIANQLASKYARPTLILREIEHYESVTDTQGNLPVYYTFEGSGRNYGKSRLENLRQFCLDTGYVMYAEGHASAFGIGITEENLGPFREAVNYKLRDFDNTPCYYVDLILDWNKISDNEIFNIASYNDIWGQQLDEPLIAFTNVPVNKDNIAFLGANERTLRITLPEHKTNMIKFNMKDDQKTLLDPGDGTLTLTVIGKCDLNHYMGNATPQIKIEDYEIMKRVIWDF